MGRRLLMILGIAVAVAFGVRLVLAQQVNPPSASPQLPSSVAAIAEAPAPSQMGEVDELLRDTPPPLPTRTVPPTDVRASESPTQKNEASPDSTHIRTRGTYIFSTPATEAEALEHEKGNAQSSANTFKASDESGDTGPSLPISPFSGDRVPRLPSGLPLLERSDDPLRDDEAVRAQAQGVTPASGPSGTFPSTSSDPAGTGTGPDTPYVLPLERLPMGRNTVGLSVDVQAPSVVSINQETKLKIVVRNTGSSEAMGVVVRDQLPEGLVFVRSQPSTEPVGQILTWVLGTMAANSDRVLTVTVKPTQVGSFDHAATVTMRAGGKSRTLVQEPKLKVEQTVKRSKVLKGGQVEFKIVVSNPGTGPARKVVVQAKLSQGLHHEQGDHIEQTIDVIKPGEHVELDTLIADATAAGKQTCTVTALSPDVAQQGDETKDILEMSVVEPKLDLKLSGPPKRYTDTVATYKLTLQNLGTAVAKNVKAYASIPIGGTVLPDPTNVAYDRQYDRVKRRLLWTIPQLDPKARVELSFSVRLGGIQLYQIAADARAEAPLFLIAKDTCSTDVTGMPDVDFQVSERRRVVDVGEQTTYEIRLKNHGSKEASQLLVTARLSDQLEVDRTVGLPQGEQAGMSRDGRDVTFPRVDHLAPKSEIVLTLRVKAVKPGIAKCEVFLVHDDLENNKLTRTAITRVTESADSLTR
jgi:uncharacterized repeat protein (TIGR01451 family)